MGYKFNPFTGNLDKVGGTSISAAQIKETVLAAINEMKTTRVGALGNKLYAYDITEDKWVELGPQLVFDEDGNVITGEDDG